MTLFVKPSLISKTSLGRLRSLANTACPLAEVAPLAEWTASSNENQVLAIFSSNAAIFSRNAACQSSAYN
jgi:hypothetical protein